MLMCFLVASVFAKADQTSAADLKGGHSAKQTPVVMVDVSGLSEKSPHASSERCACEKASGNAVSLICGVVLATTNCEFTMQARTYDKSERLLTDWQMPSSLTNKLKKPPRIVL